MADVCHQLSLHPALDHIPLFQDPFLRDLISFKRLEVGVNQIQPGLDFSNITNKYFS